MEFIDEIRRVRSAVEKTRDDALEFLLKTKTDYDETQLKHEEVVEIISQKLTQYAKASDHMIALKVAGYFLEREKGKRVPSQAALAYSAELAANDRLATEVHTLRFACVDLRSSLDRVIAGLVDLKRTLFEGRR